MFIDDLDETRCKEVSGQGKGVEVCGEMQSESLAGILTLQTTVN
jgi:hypothetical protein